MDLMPKLCFLSVVVYDPSEQSTSIICLLVGIQQNQLIAHSLGSDQTLILSIIRITSPQEAPELRATITCFTFFYRVAECSGFTSFVWMSLSSLISLLRLSSNSANLAWQALITSSCSEIWLVRSLIFSSLNSIRLLNYSGTPPSLNISSSMLGFFSLQVAIAIFNFQFQALSSAADLASFAIEFWLPPRIKVVCSFWKLGGAELPPNPGLNPGFITSFIVRLAVILYLIYSTIIFISFKICTFNSRQLCSSLPAHPL